MAHVLSSFFVSVKFPSRAVIVFLGFFLSCRFVGRLVFLFSAQFFLWYLRLVHFFPDFPVWWCFFLAVFRSASSCACARFFCSKFCLSAPPHPPRTIRFSCVGTVAWFSFLTFFPRVSVGHKCFFFHPPFRTPYVFFFQLFSRFFFPCESDQ